MAAVASLAGLSVLAGTAVPASAHTLGPGVAALNYRTVLLAVTPDPTGVSFTVVDDGMHVIARNDTGTVLTIRGYAGEPYLEVDHWGAWENLRSPATYLDETFTPGAVPAYANGKATPVWRRISSGDTVMWHDHLLHWMGTAPPAQVRADPGRYNLISTWRIDATYGGRPIHVTGSLAWVPSSSPAGWLVVLGLAAVAAAVMVTRRRGRWWNPGVLVLLAAVDAVRSIGLIEGRGGPLSTRLQALPWSGAADLAVWIVMVATAAVSWRRQVLARYVACFGSAAVLLLDGAVSLPGLWRSQVIAWHPWWLERLLIAVTIGIAVGALAGGLVQLRRMSRLASGRLAAATLGGTLLLSGCGGTAHAASAPVIITTTTLPRIGPVLANSQGHVLYMFEPDRHHAVTCSVLCQGSWPPVTVPSGRSLTADRSVRSALLGTDPNPAGGPPVATYNGWPLYTYISDVAPSVAYGQALDLNGGLWYVLSPTGHILKQKAPA
jgi:predicted lipoprotein with Yx(FWY)xxD motif